MRNYLEKPREGQLERELARPLEKIVSNPDPRIETDYIINAKNRLKATTKGNSTSHGAVVTPYYTPISSKTYNRRVATENNLPLSAILKNTEQYLPKEDSIWNRYKYKDGQYFENTPWIQGSDEDIANLKKSGFNLPYKKVDRGFLPPNLLKKDGGTINYINPLYKWKK